MSAVLTGDPTLAAVEAFNDPSQWDEVVENVPAFVCHSIEGADADGRPKLVAVDPARLQRIADKINRNWSENGVAVKFFDGHSKNPSEVPQSEQPPILGYGIDARVGPWGPKGKLGILLKQYVKKGCLAATKERPFRSAEFYDESDEITGVALLKTDPRLDMGMVFYGRSDGCLMYQRRGRAPVYLYLETNMADEPTPATKPVTDPTTPPDAAAQELDPALEAGMNQYMKKKFPHLPAMHQKYAESCAPSMYGEGMQTPDATNPMPGEKKDEPEKYGGSNELRGKNQDAQIRAMNSDGSKGANGDGGDYHPKHDEYGRNGAPLQYQQQISALVKKTSDQDAQLTQLGRQLKYGRELMKLRVDEGCEFDYDAELADCLEMGEPAFTRHLDRIRKYEKSPVSTQRVRTAEPPAPPAPHGGQAFTQERLEQSLHYMRTNKCSWDEAVKATEGK